MAPSQNINVEAELARMDGRLDTMQSELNGGLREIKALLAGQPAKLIVAVMGSVGSAAILILAFLRFMSAG